MARLEELKMYGEIRGRDIERLTEATRLRDQVFGYLRGTEVLVNIPMREVVAVLKNSNSRNLVLVIDARQNRLDPSLLCVTIDGSGWRVVPCVIAETYLLKVKYVLLPVMKSERDREWFDLYLDHELNSAGVGDWQLTRMHLDNAVDPRDKLRHYQKAVKMLGLAQPSGLDKFRRGFRKLFRK